MKWFGALVALVLVCLVVLAANHLGLRIDRLDVVADTIATPAMEVATAPRQPRLQQQPEPGGGNQQSTQEKKFPLPTTAQEADVEIPDTEPARQLEPIVPLAQPAEAPAPTPVPRTQATVPSVEPKVTPPPIPVAEPEQLYVFWQPFRTRISAQGFAQSLTARSDVPVEVIEDIDSDARQYRVALPYLDEAQRQERVAQLAATTRLEIR